ncbi:MAG TPA: heme ABC exporter ATP-binding protein CcmA [Gemmatimonadaceae bacterium]|nr:heme ABC exporter ATP-binding protein CcmA [Gemmatimonadaceae bacterium]
MSAATDPALAIDASGVARRFGTSWVLRGATLRVHSGEVVGLLGANGSGKSTLLRIFSTLLRPHAGTVQVWGHDAVRAPHAVRSLVGYLSHSPGLYDDLTARENLLFAASMLGRDPRDVDVALDRVDLLDAADRRVRGLSAGMQRRLALARLLLVRPRLLLLDEPYSNLDPDGILLVNSLIGEWAAEGAAALVVLHELAPARGVLHRTVSIRDGRIVAAPHIHAGARLDGPVAVSSR